MKKLTRKKNMIVAMLLLSSLIATGCVESDTDIQQSQQMKQESVDVTQKPNEISSADETAKEQEQEVLETDNTSSGAQIKDGYYEYNGKSYEIIEVDGGDRSGTRESNVAVDIGFGDRVYWGLTNEYGQLVYVLADEIILQDDKTEPVNAKGRYYDDEANVPGTERPDLDQGHVIADSLGGVSNAYNITPQNSTLNRHGDQAYMEKVIRDAGGCTNFVAMITYPDTTTQIPSSYKYEYTLKGNNIVDEFPNGDPEKTGEEANTSAEANTSIETSTSKPTEATFDEKAELSKIDTNGNGKVTIKEAKAAGYTMPIYSDHWLYKYMDDKDGDGKVGE